MNISDHSQTLCFTVADLYVIAKSFYPKSRSIHCIGCDPQACGINSDRTLLTGQKVKINAVVLKRKEWGSWWPGVAKIEAWMWVWT